MIRALSIASTGMAAQQLSLEVIANNLANVSTTGFKRSIWEFQDLMYQTMKVPGTATETGTIPVGFQVGSGVKPVSVHKSFEQGEPRRTDNPLDLTIQGDGFFQLSLPDGSTAYTRTGAFKVDSEGNIVSTEGYPLIPDLSLPTDTKSITITPEGAVSVTTSASSDPTEVGALELARFVNPAGLESKGRNLYQQTAASGDAVTGTPGLEGFGSIEQGALEASNVSIAEEMVRMIEAQRVYEINSKTIQSADEMLGIANAVKR